MNWTKEEEELIVTLDRFVKNWSQLPRLSDKNHFHFLEQILTVTKGDLNSTSQYCQQMLEEETTSKKERVDSISDDSFSFQQSINSTHSVAKNKPITKEQKIFKHKKFSSFWTLLFLVLTTITILFTAKKSPNSSSINTVPNIAVLCPANLIENARLGIRNHNESLLKMAIADFQALKEQQGDRIGIECQQILWESQFIYAIDFLASRGQVKEAVNNLCAISEEYYQSREVIPWFRRWSNTNSNFKQWLEGYKIQNNCPVASYLE